MVGHFAAGVASTGDRVRVINPPQTIPRDNIGVFHGLSRGTRHIFEKTRAAKQPFVYIDNCYVGRRSEWFRVTNNALMAQTPETHPGAKSDGQRFKALEINIDPWQENGSHILLCLQSDLYFELLVKRPRARWVSQVGGALRTYTDRPIIIRDKPNQHREQPPLSDQLKNCHAVVTWNSTVAVEAMIKGIPAICLDPFNSFQSVCSNDLSTIENLKKRSGRLALLEWLADNQWTKYEIQSGQCWTAIRNQW